MKDALADATPVDTGYARSRWDTSLGVSQQGTLQVSITNDAPYIEELNRGSSRQAPARFIEETLLFHLGTAEDEDIEYE